jgi:molybdopterin converting factor small subunit
MNTATITVKLFGSLRGKAGPDQKMVISKKETIRAVVERLSIDPQASYLYSVNGHQTKADAPLQDGDVLLIVPPISGG